MTFEGGPVFGKVIADLVGSVEIAMGDFHGQTMDVGVEDEAMIRQAISAPKSADLAGGPVSEGEAKPVTGAKGNLKKAPI